jgi:hypothetical protein
VPCDRRRERPDFGLGLINSVLAEMGDAQSAKRLDLLDTDALGDGDEPDIAPLAAGAIKRVIDALTHAFEVGLNSALFHLAFRPHHST